VRPRRTGPTVFLIGIAAERAGMHPQTLRVYERRGLIRPRRSARNTRLYSQADVDLLRRIQELGDEGLNLAGIERVLKLERRAERAERRVTELERRLEEAEEEHRRELSDLRRKSEGTQLVRIAAETSTSLVPRYTPIVARRGTKRRTV
jgi:MerR family transcriptional regulator, heat shock protein HspR